MKDKWYGDNRDLVKWGVLLQLASTYGASMIVQVAYYRPETIDIEGVSHPLPSAVIKHFRRDLVDIKRLSDLRVQIEVLDAPVESFDSYTEKVLGQIKKVSVLPGSPCLIFLDPDTGLEPKKGKLRLEHVRECDLRRIWQAMRRNDVLVFYQHKTDHLKHKKDSEWIEPKRKQFESALSSFSVTAKIAKGGVATDVVFLYAQKLEFELSKEESNEEKCGKECPQCGHQFTGNTFGGIDAHWRANHEAIMPYEEAWPLIRSGKYSRREAPIQL